MHCKVLVNFSDQITFFDQFRDVMSRGILTQNGEVMYRVIVYNYYRITRNSLLIVDGFYLSLIHISEPTRPY